MAKKQTKPAVKSGTIWGGVLAIVPLIVTSFPDVAKELAPILSPQTAAILGAIGGILAIYKRVSTGDSEPIKGLVRKK